MMSLKKQRIELFSPAKINLFLKVIAKRSDRYHDLYSLFQTVSLGDTLSIQVNNKVKDQLFINTPDLPTNDDNLVIQALHRFRQKKPFPYHFDICLKKNIPWQAGLGGGSGNAASILWGVNQLLHEPVPVETLQKWSETLGADVPFFFSKGTALCEGRGEKVTPLPALSKHKKLWIIKPKNIALSTPKVFDQFKLNTIDQTSTFSLLQAVQKGDFMSSAINDLELAAFQLRPELKDIKKILSVMGFNPVTMTGSGASFFCMGNIELTSHPLFDAYPVYFINRKLNNWYDPKN